jgi:four helix bundle protein
MKEDKKYIKHAYDLDVYQRMFRVSKVIIKKVIPKLPQNEKYDLVDQMRRASKAAVAILSEGFPKRFQQRHRDKYITDSLGECEEMITHLMYVRDVYSEYVIPESTQILIDEYERSMSQLNSLSKSWKQYHKNKK